MPTTDDSGCSTHRAMSIVYRYVAIRYRIAIEWICVYCGSINIQKKKKTIGDNAIKMFASFPSQPSLFLSFLVCEFTYFRFRIFFSSFCQYQL